ncbi:hypothetical protein HGRIS_002223 [Hohenbuehelia grisea]|uniref:Uncharacterized protein n=1 Tax=Hohenbuehelia grisea TaxID=104357 RepID=A0ABR3JKZ8_9AGAR
MSYASVAAHNAPSPSEQPHADTALLNTEVPSAGNVADDTSKLNLVDPSFKSHPATYTSEARIPPDDDDFSKFTYVSGSSGSRPGPKKKQIKHLKEIEAEGAYLWQVTKNWLFRPGVAGGLIGVVNLGLLIGAGRAFYTQPHLRHDRSVVSKTIAGALALLLTEGYAAEKYAETPRGQQEARRAKEEGAVIYKHLREVILRPGVLGGLVGLLNTAILGTVGYFSYVNWNKPTWDRRTVSAVSVGLLSLCGVEGAIAERYRKSH